MEPRPTHTKASSVFDVVPVLLRRLLLNVPAHAAAAGTCAKDVDDMIRAAADIVVNRYPLRESPDIVWRRDVSWRIAVELFRPHLPLHLCLADSVAPPIPGTRTRALKQRTRSQGRGHIDDDGIGIDRDNSTENDMDEDDDEEEDDDDDGLRDDHHILHAHLLPFESAGMPEECSTDPLPNRDVDMDTARADARTLLKNLIKFAMARKRASTELILEVTFQHLRFGLVEEAYTFLDHFVEILPYREDPILQGYAGMVCYLRWRIEAASIRHSHSSLMNSLSRHHHDYDDDDDDSNEDEDEDSEVDRNLSSLHYSRALTHFEQSFALDLSSDMFVLYYCRLVTAAEHHDKALAVLDRFYESCPDNPNAHRYLLHFHLDQKNPPEEWVPLARSLLERDPLADESITLVPLIDHLERTAADDTLIRHTSSSSSSASQEIADSQMTEVAITPSAADGQGAAASISIANLLADRLDLIAGGDLWMWRKLLTHIDRLTANQRRHIWGDRQWWPAFHLPWLSQPQDTDSDAELTIVTSFVVLLRIFSDLPNDNNSEATINDLTLRLITRFEPPNNTLRHQPSIELLRTHVLESSAAVTAAISRILKSETESPPLPDSIARLLDLGPSHPLHPSVEPWRPPKPPRADADTSNSNDDDHDDEEYSKRTGLMRLPGRFHGYGADGNFWSMDPPPEDSSSSEWRDIDDELDDAGIFVRRDTDRTTTTHDNNNDDDEQEETTRSRIRRRARLSQRRHRTSRCIVVTCADGVTTTVATPARGRPGSARSTFKTPEFVYDSDAEVEYFRPGNKRKRSRRLIEDDVGDAGAAASAAVAGPHGDPIGLVGGAAATGRDDDDDDGSLPKKRLRSC